MIDGILLLHRSGHTGSHGVSLGDFGRIRYLLECSMALDLLFGEEPFKMRLTFALT